MNVLSLFDGISVGCLALSRAGIEVDTYYASEIDPYAEKISESNWSGIVRLGDVRDWPMWDFKDVRDVDLIMAGSPCQGFSFAGKQLAFDDPRSKLFFEFVDCVKRYKPRFILLENVRMKKEFQDIITNMLQDALDTYGGGKVYKTNINSALVSAQNRDRFYWTNWPVSQPEDRGILLRDILLTDSSVDLSEQEVDESRIIPMESGKPGGIVGLYDGTNAQATRVRDTNGKAQCLTGQGGGLGAKMGIYDLSTLEVDASKYKAAKNEEIDPNKANVVGNVYPNGGQNGNVYSVDGKSKTLSAGTGIKGRGIGSSNSPKIVEPPDNLVARATVQANAEHTYDGKCPTLTASAGLGGGNVPLIGDKDIMDEHKGKYLGKERHNPRIRKLHPIECERLQTLPDNYTLVLDENGKQVVSDTQRYKSLGNGWTCEIIAHILMEMKKVL